MHPIGILGGTFDPIHFGHLRMAEELREKVGLAEVRFIPAAVPPHRASPMIDARHRSEMVRLAIAGNPAFLLDARELDRPGPSYTYDTLTGLRAELGDITPLCLLVGGDAFLGLDTWHRWQALLDLAHIVVAHRPGATPREDNMPAAIRDAWRRHGTPRAEDLHATPSGRIFLQPITALDISASAIREALRQGRSARYLLPEPVFDYIHQQHLYHRTSHGT